MNNAAVTTLTATVTASATSITVNDASTFPATFPWTAVINAGNATAEVVLVTAASGNVLTVQRAYDNTAGQTHQSGEAVTHESIAADYDEANSHVNATSNVHGVVGALVGTTDTQTLSGKTLASPAVTGTITGGAGATLGAVTATSVTASGEVQGATVSATGDVTATGDVNGATIHLGGTALFKPTGFSIAGGGTSASIDGTFATATAGMTGSQVVYGDTCTYNSGSGSITVPTTGLYTAYFAGKSTGATVTAQLKTQVNGSDVLAAETAVYLPQSGLNFSASFLLQLNANDAVRIQGATEDGSTDSVTRWLFAVARVA